jgi:hypothetical protein
LPVSASLASLSASDETHAPHQFSAFSPKTVPKKFVGGVRGGGRGGAVQSCESQGVAFSFFIFYFHKISEASEAAASSPQQRHHFFPPHFEKWK